MAWVRRSGYSVRPVRHDLSNESLEDINPVARAGVPAIELWREDVAPAFCHPSKLKTIPILQMVLRK
jgi:hypothetical protein